MLVTAQVDVTFLLRDASDVRAQVMLRRALERLAQDLKGYGAEEPRFEVKKFIMLEPRRE